MRWTKWYEGSGLSLPSLSLSPSLYPLLSESPSQNERWPAQRPPSLAGYYRCCRQAFVYGMTRAPGQVPLSGTEPTPPSWRSAVNRGDVAVRQLATCRCHCGGPEERTGRKPGQDPSRGQGDGGEASEIFCSDQSGTICGSECVCASSNRRNGRQGR